MKWGTSAIRFIRPIRWILALYNDKIVPLNLETLVSGRITYGHRLLTPGPIKVNNVDEYFKILKDRFVIIDPVIRKNSIQSQIIKIIKDKNGREYIDQLLLDEVTNLVEFPKVLLGEFDRKYLELPTDVLTAVMIKHQKYFPIYITDDTLLPFFLVVINGNEEKYSKSILKGNERVLKARLEDAKFFFQEDQKTVKPGIKPLDSKLDNLKNVVFQDNLGNIFDKVERLVFLSKRIAEDLQLDNTSIKILERSAYLCKSDLVTEMVKEFPDLQGIMGKHYALLQGEEVEVANTIYEHYLPRYSGDIFPASVTGSILSIADKLDNIVSCFLNNLVPDGSQDPYALRRQSLGIINISIINKMYFSINKMIDLNIDIIIKNNNLMKESCINNTISAKNVKDFIFQRLRYLLLEKDYRYDTIDAVFEKNPDCINDALDRIKAINTIYDSESFTQSIAAATRTFNLSRNSEKIDIDPSLFQENEEYSLYEHYLIFKKNIKDILMTRDYSLFYKTLEYMNKPIDLFFDNILVMVDDTNVRNNRLALLKNIADLYFSIADLNKITLSKSSTN